MKTRFVNQYGYPLGGCLFNKKGTGRHSMRCACANCGMWRSQRAGKFRAAQKQRREETRDAINQMARASEPMTFAYIAGKFQSVPTRLLKLNKRGELVFKKSGR